jgi:soluble lytic murein transglycosylase-like protein
VAGRDARRLRDRLRERRRQRRERKKVERHRRSLQGGRGRANRRINSAVRKATLTAALTLSAARPGVTEPQARRGGSGILAATSVPTLPDLAPAADNPPMMLLDPSRPKLLRSRNSRFDVHIEAAARKHGIAADLVRAIIQIESGFEPRAVSSKGAKGLMQLMPATAREMGARNLFDPRQNIFAGARYLRVLLDAFDGNLTLAAAAYNAGPTNVQRHGGVPPFRETRDYVEKVHALLGLGPPDLALPPPVQEALLTLRGVAPASSAFDVPLGPFRSH